MDANTGANLFAEVSQWQTRRNSSQESLTFVSIRQLSRGLGRDAVADLGRRQCQPRRTSRLADWLKGLKERIEESDPGKMKERRLFPNVNVLAELLTDGLVCCTTRESQAEHQNGDPECDQNSGKTSTQPLADITLVQGTACSN